MQRTRVLLLIPLLLEGGGGGRWGGLRAWGQRGNFEEREGREGRREGKEEEEDRVVLGVEMESGIFFQFSLTHFAKGRLLSSRVIGSCVYEVDL